MSVKSVNQRSSSFTPYSSGMEQKQLSLFSRLNLNENDKNSLQHPMRNFAEYESSDLFSMRSKKRKRSVEIQLKDSVPGNRTYLNVSLVGKSSLIHHNEFFGHQRYQDIGSGGQYDDEKKQFSEKSCPVGPSYNFQEDSEQRLRARQIESQIKPRFHKTKNMLRTISNYLHKFILHNKRCLHIKQRFFRKLIVKKIEKQEAEDKISISQFEKIKINEDSENLSIVGKSKKIEKRRRKSKSSVRSSLNGDSMRKSSIESKGESSKHQTIQGPQRSEQVQKQVQQKIKQFDRWVQTLSVINFADYQRVWTDQHQFTGLYRQICYRYYKQQVYCDVMRSRLTTKQITNQYMCQFIEGLFNPKQFYRFK